MVKLGYEAEDAHGSGEGTSWPNAKSACESACSVCARFVLGSDGDGGVVIPVLIVTATKGYGMEERKEISRTYASLCTL